MKLLSNGRGGRQVVDEEVAKCRCSGRLEYYAAATARGEVVVEPPS